MLGSVELAGGRVQRWLRTTALLRLLFAIVPLSAHDDPEHQIDEKSPDLSAFESLIRCRKRLFSLSEHSLTPPPVRLVSACPVGNVPQDLSEP